MEEIVTAIILLAMGIGALAISIRSFQEKGFLLNNAYLYASKKERENMDKKPHYWQTAIVSLLAGIALLLGAVAFISGSGWVLYIAAGVLAAMMVYAIVSSAREQ